VIVACQCQAHHINTTAKFTKFTDLCSAPAGCNGLDGELNFDIYIIPCYAGKATFVMDGDGGAINWGWAGHFDRPGNGKTVIFNP
jgi:hypothetical protein